MTHVSRQWGALEADFQRFYGLDLGRLLWVDRVGCRRLWDLIAGLPAESAFQRALAAVPAEAPKFHGKWRELFHQMSGR